MVEWKDVWMHGWLSVCVGCLLVVEMLGLWRGLISRKPKLLLTINQHTHSPTHAFNYPSINHPPVHSPTHPFTHPFIHPPSHSSTHPFLDEWVDLWCIDAWIDG